MPQQKLLISKITITGSAKYDGAFLTNHTPSEVQAAAAYDDFNEIVWEVAIPFHIFYKDSIDSSDIGKKISIGLIQYGLDESDMGSLPQFAAPGNVPEGMSDGPAGMGGGGMGGIGGGPGGGGMGGGGMGGGPGGGMPGNNIAPDNTTNRNRALVTVKTWKKIALQYK